MQIVCQVIDPVADVNRLALDCIWQLSEINAGQTHIDARPGLTQRLDTFNYRGYRHLRTSQPGKRVDCRDQKQFPVLHQSVRKNRPRAPGKWPGLRPDDDTAAGAELFNYHPGPCIP